MKQTFEQWINGKGIDICKMSSVIVERQPKPQSTLKHRAEAIKEAHNHKFMIKRDIDAGVLYLYERVNRLKFERV